MRAMSVHFEPQAHIRDFIDFRRREAENELRELVPYAELEHVGSTAVPSGWTNGEVDIQVRVPAEMRGAAEKLIAERYTKDDAGGMEGFSYYRHEGRGVRLHVTVVDEENDLLKRQRDLLLEQPLLRDRYDGIKRRHQDGDIAAYQAEKQKFWSENGRA